MKYEITINVIFNKDKINKEDVMEWLSISEYFQPKEMKCKRLTKGKYYKYSKKKFYENLEQELLEAYCSIKIFKLNDEELKNQQYYPYDLVHFIDEGTKDIYSNKISMNKRIG
jgi:hypothetical protein